MTPRQARRERRTAERKTREAEIRRAKADLMADPDLPFQAEQNSAPAQAAAGAIGFVSQNSPPPAANPDADREPTLLNWVESARRPNLPQRLSRTKQSKGNG